MLSIVIPAHNEAGTIAALAKALGEVSRQVPCEIIFVDDGSTDATPDEIKKITGSGVKAVRLPARSGKGRAVFEGFRLAAGEIVVSLDADLQAGPDDILKLIPHFENPRIGCVIGARQNRADGFCKAVSSRIGNAIHNAVFGLSLTDNNSPLRAFRAGPIRRILYFEQYHRFLPALTGIQGYELIEVSITHHPRVYGVSKYGLHNRILGNLTAMVKIKIRPQSYLASAAGA